MKVNDFVKIPNGDTARITKEYYQRYTVVILSEDHKFVIEDFKKNELKKYDLKLNFNQIKEIIGHEFVKSLTYKKNNILFEIETVNYLSAYFAFIESEKQIFYFVKDKEDRFKESLNDNSCITNFKKILNYYDLVNSIFESDINFNYSNEFDNDFDKMALELIKLLEE